MVLKMRIRAEIFVGIVIFLLISGSFAFSLAAEEKSTCAESIRHDVEQEALADAMNAFNARDYKRAKIGFEILSESAQNPEIARQALFGLSSAKLVLANTSDEYEDAISSWEKWSAQVNSWQGCEDPRMITPFLLRLQASITGAAGSLAEGRRAAKEIDSRVVLQTKEKEMQSSSGPGWSCASVKSGGSATSLNLSRKYIANIRRRSRKPPSDLLYPEMKLSTKPIILVVDDDLNILAVLEARLSSIDYRVLTASGAEEALELLKDRPVDLMITDVKMPGMGGMDLFSAAHEIRPGLPVMFLTAYGTIPDAVKALKAGAIDYLTKPFNGRDLISKVQEVLKKSAPKSTLDTLPPLSESLWGGKSPAMRELYDLVDRIARSDVNVLILGESGVGKERVARLLHQRGPRREQPFHCCGLRLHSERIAGE